MTAWPARVRIGLEGGRRSVWVPTTRLEIPRETGVPDIVMISPGVRVVPAMEKPAGYGLGDWAPFAGTGEAGRSRVWVPMIILDWPKDIRVPEMVTADPSSEIVVPAIE